MTKELDRLTASVGRIADDVAKIAVQIRNHPAAAGDGDALNTLADKLDAASNDLDSVTEAAPAPAETPAS